jgi:hypothetical protein
MSENRHHLDADGELEALPLDVQELYRDLLRDGADWRAAQPVRHDLTRRIDDLMRQLPAAQETRLAARRALRARASVMSFETKGTETMRQTPWRGFVAAAAMVAVVAVLAGMFISAAQRHSGGVTGTGRPATGADLPEAVTGRWVTLDKLTVPTDIGAAGAPAVAPSNPRVVYEAADTSSVSGWNATLRRTDDNGATWHQLSVPVNPADVNYISLFVSPLDARTVYLQLSDEAATSCAPGNSGTGMVRGDIVASGSGWCSLEYYSTDAGDHWHPVQLPVRGVLSGWGLSTPALYAQGQRLYASANCVDMFCTRILTSTDGGVTWQIADASLVASGLNECDFAATSTGATVFAVLSAGDCSRPDQSPRTLWRSDDAGAHWRRISTLPSRFENGLFVVSQSASAQPLLYANLPRTLSTTKDKLGDAVPVLSDAATDLMVSADGGLTWTAAPAKGVSAGLKPFASPLGVLSDGSVVVMFSPAGSDDPSGGVLYSWRAGAPAWHSLAPAVPSGFIQALTILPVPGRGDLLWAATRIIPTDSNPVPYRVAVFQS